ncbi:MAG: hypothetical protein C5B49_08205 [Bdellovibrio sp.]|nr:MAG: hypothetical protein C5B49_08205 [Bdellovibrio sp.]
MELKVSQVLNQSETRKFFVKALHIFVLALGLFAIYSSTSFASAGGSGGGNPNDATEKKPVAPAAAFTDPGQTVNGKGGGTQTNGKTCLPGAQIGNLSADGTGLDNDNLPFDFTERGPEFHFCGTIIAADPSNANDRPRPGSTNPPPGKEYGWCVKNADLAKKIAGPNVRPADTEPNKFHCNSQFTDQTNPDSASGGSSQSQQQAYQETITFRIDCGATKSLVAKIITDKDKDGNTTMSRIQVSSTDNDQYKNLVEIRESFDKQDDEGKKVKGQVSISLKKKSGANGDPDIGTLLIPLQGTRLDEDSSRQTQRRSASDQEEGFKFKSCSVSTDGGGPKSKSETPEPFLADLTKCNIYRGATAMLSGERSDECNSGVDPVGTSLFKFSQKSLAH